MKVEVEAKVILTYQKEIDKDLLIIRAENALNKEGVVYLDDMTRVGVRFHFFEKKAADKKAGKPHRISRKASGQAVSGRRGFGGNTYG